VRKEVVEMDRWEYKTVVVEAQEAEKQRSDEELGDFLNGHGAQGWELVSFGPDDLSAPGSVHYYEAVRYRAVFKRRAQA
jgi:hypothetical protein